MQVSVAQGGRLALLLEFSHTREAAPYDSWKPKNYLRHLKFDVLQNCLHLFCDRAFSKQMYFYPFYFCALVDIQFKRIKADRFKLLTNAAHLVGSKTWDISVRHYLGSLLGRKTTSFKKTLNAAFLIIPSCCFYIVMTHINPFVGVVSESKAYGNE